MSEEVPIVTGVTVSAPPPVGHLSIPLGNATRSHLDSGTALTRILRSPDDRKFVSSLTLMEQAVNQSDTSDNLSAQMQEILQIAQEQGFDRCQRTIAWLENE